MSQERIDKLQQKQEDQEYKILSLEKSIEALFPPLIEQLKDVSTKLSDNTEAIMKSTIAQEHLSADVKELKESSVEKQKRISEIEKRQAANQVVIDAVKGLGSKLVMLGITVITAAIGLAVTISKTLG